MVQEKTFYNCRYFGKPECRHSDDEFLMKRLINLMDNNKYAKDLADTVNELRCDYCEVFEMKSYRDN